MDPDDFDEYFSDADQTENCDIEDAEMDPEEEGFISGFDDIYNEEDY